MSDNTTPHQADTYDRGVRQTIPFYETLHQETIDLIKTVKPDVAGWLDTGCGTGGLIALALPLFPHTQFVLADPSEAMLEQARQRLAGQPEAHVKILPPLPSEQLGAHAPQLKPQVITAIMCHHYLQPPQRRAALQTCYELLEPGGLLITFENIDCATECGTQVGLARWQRFQIEHGRAPEAVAEHLRRFKTHLLPITVSEYLELLQAVGFQTVELFWRAQMQAGFYALKESASAA